MIVHELDTDEVKAVLLSHVNAKFPNNPVNSINITSTSTFPDERHPLLVVRTWWDPVVNGRKPKMGWFARFNNWRTARSHVAADVAEMTAQAISYRNA